MDSLITKSINLILAVGIGLELAASCVDAEQLASKLIDRCCQVGRDRAAESPRFNCKLSAREALLQPSDRAGQLLALSAESLLLREPNLTDQCELVLESCCLAHHRTRNCNSGKQFAKSGSACMDVELSKEATVATESFNDCCMTCSLGILAARNPAQNDSSTRWTGDLNERCKLMSPLASSLSGQLYEQTYIECCQENLPRPSGALVFDSGASVDCSQTANVCSQRCLAVGSQDPITRRPVDQDRCDCFAGFKLAPDGVSCVDVDECKTNLHTCNKHSEVCDNTRGSFRCLARSQHQQPSQRVRSMSLEESRSGGDESAFVALAEQPFASQRLCPLGSRWLANENRCISSNQAERAGNLVNGREQQWKRSVAFSSSSSSSSSRRSSRTD